MDQFLPQAERVNHKCTNLLGTLGPVLVNHEIFKRKNGEWKTPVGCLKKVV